MDTTIVAQFLDGLLSPVGAGVFLWLIVGSIIKAFPGMTGDVKFWLTMALAFLISPGAYGLRVWLGYDTFTSEGLILSIGASYLLSQTIHRGSEEIKAAVKAK